VTTGYLVGAAGGKNAINWHPLIIVPATVSVLLSCLVPLIPESPAYEREKTRRNSFDSADGKLFQKKYAMALLTGSLFSVFQQLTGINAILTNLTKLFSDAGISIEPNLAAAFASFAQIISTFTAGFLMECLGRRIVWLISFGGVCLIDLLYGIVRHDTVKGYLGERSSIPIIMMFLCYLAFGFGAGPIPWFIVSEMFPDSVRPSATTVCSIVHWVSAFVVIMIFPYLKDALEEWRVFLLFSGCTFFGTVFGLYFIKNPPKQGEIKFQYDELMRARFSVSI
jgi:Na+/melibiose symporter-like transporter